MGKRGSLFSEFYNGEVLLKGSKEVEVQEFVVNKEDVREEKLLHTLLKVEFKKYISKSILAFNSSIGAIGYLICISLFIFDIQEYNIPLAHLIVMSGNILFCMLPTTATSISFEGENFHQLKALPISPKEIIKAKILLNLLINIPFLVIGSIMILFSRNISLLDGFVVTLTIMFAIMFTTIFALIMNMIFYKLNWKVEEEVINKSLAVFINLGMVVITSVITWTIIAYSLVIPLVFYIIATILVSLFIKKHGERLFMKIS